VTGAAQGGAAMDYTHVIVGGGMYGCWVALRLAAAERGARIAIVEREPDLLRRASWNNQARVHGGYHYPRSLLTGIRSRANAPRFEAEFPSAIDDTFEHYYAIARNRSNVTPEQFRQFCRRIGADLRPAPPRIRGLFDADAVEAVFGVTEYAFDADRLREALRRRLRDAGVAIATGMEAVAVASGAAALRLAVTDLQSGETHAWTCRFLYNCTYSALNRLLARSGLRTVRLTHEATEIALVEPPGRLRNLGITVMCGPFFSMMPFPPAGLASLSHVRYTPHYSWTEGAGEGAPAAHRPAFPLASNFERMRRDAARYVPAMRECAHVRSLWEVKTILPQSDANDSRPILLKRDARVPRVMSLLGGKIDNVFDLDEALSRPGADARPAAPGGAP
jgi:glycine/D-amino acid oxidase-like deaminating enzyme